MPLRDTRMTIAILLADEQHLFLKGCCFFGRYTSRLSRVFLPPRYELLRSSESELTQLLGSPKSKAGLCFPVPPQNFPTPSFQPKGALELDLPTVNLAFLTLWPRQFPRRSPEVHGLICNWWHVTIPILQMSKLRLRVQVTCTVSPIR